MDALGKNNKMTWESEELFLQGNRRKSFLFTCLIFLLLLLLFSFIKFEKKEEVKKGSTSKVALAAQAPLPKLIEIRNEQYQVIQSTSGTGTGGKSGGSSGVNPSPGTQTSPGVVPTPGRQGPTNHFGSGINGNGDDFGQGSGSGTGIGDGDGDGENFIDKGIGGSGSRIRYPASLSKFSGLPADVVTISFKLTVRPDGTVRRAEEVLSTASHTIKPSILSEVKAEILRKIKYKPASQETINWFTLVIYSK